MPVQWSAVRAHKENKSSEEASIHSLWTWVPGPLLQQGPDSLKHGAAIAPEGVELLTHANINQKLLYWSQVNYAGVTSMWQRAHGCQQRLEQVPFHFSHGDFSFSAAWFCTATIAHRQLWCNRAGWLIFRRNHTLRSMHTVGTQLEPNVSEAM